MNDVTDNPVVSVEDLSAEPSTKKSLLPFFSYLVLLPLYFVLSVPLLFEGDQYIPLLLLFLFAPFIVPVMGRSEKRWVRYCAYLLAAFPFVIIFLFLLSYYFQTTFGIYRLRLF
jgi:hypothetical protein